MERTPQAEIPPRTGDGADSTPPPPPRTTIPTHIYTPIHNYFLSRLSNATGGSHPPTPTDSTSTGPPTSTSDINSHSTDTVCFILLTQTPYRRNRNLEPFSQLICLSKTPTPTTLSNSLNASSSTSRDSSTTSPPPPSPPPTPNTQVTLTLSNSFPEILSHMDSLSRPISDPPNTTTHPTNTNTDTENTDTSHPLSSTIHYTHPIPTPHKLLHSLHTSLTHIYGRQLHILAHYFHRWQDGSNVDLIVRYAESIGRGTPVWWGCEIVKWVVGRGRDTDV
ncbi:hypothetical protein BC832DRAFT_563204 [Gaertneriomyces semiglobifer]|nr:hypothetical protein BC832DRAFT_563204 [Gaertneriomyces semiglobifer]